MQDKSVENEESDPVTGATIPDIRQAEEFLRAVMENSVDGIYLCQDGVLVSCNRRFAELFGFPEPGDIKGTVINKLLYSVIPAQNVHDLAGQRNLFARRLDGNEFEVEVSNKQVMYCGKPALLGIIRDVTNLRQLEKQLRQSQKMEVIGALASGVAHDFNNILSIIMGYLELSLDSRSDEATIKQNLKQALRASYRARDLVQQILSFSRKGEKEKAPVQVTPIVKEVIKLMRSSLPATIEIRQDVSESKYIVLADPTQLHQVLLNLCTNAGQAMSETGGVLEIVLSDFNRDMEAIYKEPLPPSPYLRLTVSDTGHGMTPEVKERIFDLFFTTKQDGQGTGIGLAVVKGIVKNLDGEISVESEPGKGASFHIFLPLLHEDIEVEEEKREKAIPRGSEQVLLVEDERVLLNLVSKMLERLGYRVVPKSDSLEALEVFRAKPDVFDVVISDLTMPGMTGIQLARELIKIRPGIPIIICTGFNEGINRENLRDLGMEGLLMKPYSMAKLSAAIRDILD